MADDTGHIEVKELVENFGKTITEIRERLDGVEDKIDPKNQKAMDKALEKAAGELQEVALKQKVNDAASAKMLEQIEDMELTIARGGFKSAGDGEFARTKFDDMQNKFLRNGSDDSAECKEFADGVIDSIVEQELSMKSGPQVDLMKMKMKSLVSGSNPDGGFFITPDMRGRIDARAFRTSPMRALATVTNTVTDSVEWTLDDAEADAGWVGEVTSRPDTGTPDVGRVTIPLHELYAQPSLSQRLIDDAGFDVEGWIVKKVADRFGRLENTAFVIGDGAAKARGFLNYGDANAGVSYDNADAYERHKLGSFGLDIEGGTDVVVAGGLKEFQSILKPEYAGGANWVMSHKLFGQKIVTLKDSTGQFLLRFGDSLRAGDTPQLLGRPVVMANDMPDSGSSGTYPIAYGDFKDSYMIVDRIGVRVLRDPFTNKPFVRFYTTKRTGGAVINFDALKRIKQS